MSLEELKRSRVAARGWLKRATIRLDKASSAADIDIVELESVISEFDNRLSSLDDVQSKIELVLPDEEVDEDVGKAADVRDEAVESRIRALQALRAKSEAVRGETAVAGSEVGHGESGSLSSRSQSVKLPKLELPKFSGDVLEWSAFWDQFVASIDSSDLPENSKLVYLRSLLVGEAKKCVKGLAIVKDNYEIACDLLIERYARPSRIIFTHIDRLLMLRLCDGNDLKSVQDALLLHVRSLERLGEASRDLTPLVLSRLPESFRVEWARNSTGKESDLNFLLECLKAEISRLDRSRTLERSRAASESRAPIVREQRSGRQRQPPAASALQATSAEGAHPAGAVAGAARGAVPRVASASTRCSFCRKSHPTVKCRKVCGMTVPQRLNRIKYAGRASFVSDPDTEPVSALSAVPSVVAATTCCAACVVILVRIQGTQPRALLPRGDAFTVWSCSALQ